MSDYEEVVSSLRHIMSGVRYVNFRQATTGKLNADGSLNLNATEGLPDGYIWVRFGEDRSAAVVKNLTMRNAAGVHVEVVYDSYHQEDQVWEIDRVRALEAMGAAAAAAMGVPEIGAGISTPVSARDVVPGGVFVDVDGGLNVRIAATWTPFGAWWDGATVITLTPTATANSKSLVLVGIQHDGTVTTDLTADRGLAYPLVTPDGVPTAGGAADIKAVMDAAPDVWWIGAVELTNGATSIDASKIVDRRFWTLPEMGAASSGAAGSSGLVPAPAAGDQTRFLRGDATWAEVAGGGTAVEPLALLDSEVVGSAVSSVTLTIPSGYKHLLVMYKVKSTRTDDTDTNLKVQFNSDTGSNYGWLNDLRRVTTPATTEDTSDPHIPIPVVGSQSSPTNQANFWTTGQFRINNYADTDNYKILDNTNDWYRSATSFGMHRVTGVWKNTAAITSIALTMTTGNIEAGSSFYVYGVGDGTNDLYYQTVKVNGAALDQRANFNFLSGAGVAVSGADDSGNDESEIAFALDIDGLAGASIDGAADYLAFYDASGTTHSKVLFNTLFGAPPAIGVITPAAGSFTAFDTSGNAVIGAAGANTARLNVNGAASGVAAILRGNATSPGNALEIQNSAGTVQSSFDATGKLTTEGAGTRILVRDTSDTAPTIIRAERGSGLSLGYIEITGNTTPSIVLNAASGFNALLEFKSGGTTNMSFGRDGTNRFFVKNSSGATNFSVHLTEPAIGIGITADADQAAIMAKVPASAGGRRAIDLLSINSHTGPYLTAKTPASRIIAAIENDGAWHSYPYTALTNAIQRALVLGHNTSGTPAANYGVSMVAQLENPSSEDVEVGRDVWLWNTATHASRKPDRVFYLTDSGGEREILRMRANGSAGAVGFFGVAPVGQQTGGAASAGASYGATEQTMLQAVYDALRAFGLIS